MERGLRARSRHAVGLLAVVLGLLTWTVNPATASAKTHTFGSSTARHATDSLIVAFKPGANTRAARSSLGNAGVASTRKASDRTALVRLRRGQSLAAVVRKLSKRSDVAFVRPNYLAHLSDAFVPDDPGKGEAFDWQQVQWNFVGQWGVNALPAWSRMRDLGREGGAGVVVAVIDTGVAYETIGRYKRSPDIDPARIVDPYDFVDNDTHANDANGHGTHVASTIAETTNNDYGVTGLAYGATLMPLRALDAIGLGDEYAMARAIRYAARHDADVINLSVEFDLSLQASDLPLVLSAMRYARRKGTLVVGAAGNQGTPHIAYPGKSPDALSVGASTIHGCLADYSDWGSGLDVVAPGGGYDYGALDGRAGSSDLQNCRASGAGSPIYQITLKRSLRRFGLPGGYEGTSMATPHVSAVAALIIASGILGEDPTPDDVAVRITETTKDLGVAGKDRRYGYGLVDAGAAVTP
ncbi:MAG: S8 family serine peptidase [Thermoleophilaceae bacterium]|nr:S8 family serine peptidase [Thermoleophilaceae bacterium]